ncbi:MAG: MBL fold metallo-hydrolase [Burkholderiales bacterium]
MLVAILSGLLALLLPLRSGGSEPVPVRVADGVYAFVGAAGDIGPGNLGRIGNSGFIVGPTGIAVVDTGVSHAHGLDLLAAIRRVSDKPVDVVILTHAVQEFLYGSTAFEDAGARLLTHRESAGLMRARCEHCLENLRVIVGEEPMAGTRLVVPDWTVDGSISLTVGGRRLELLHPGWSSTPGDLMVLDVESRVLFAGGLVTNTRVPELRDGKLGAWVGALDDLARLDLSWIVPGYGAPMRPAGIVGTRDYLRDLDARVHELYGAMASLMEAVEQGGLPRYADWPGYDSLHRKNTQQRYLELEIEELAR